MTAASRFSLARRLRAGETVYSAWCGLADPIVAELVAREGFSAVVIDQQHGLYDTASTCAGISAVHLAGAAPVVRVPVGDFAGISRMLDMGAEAVIAPMINSAGDAAALAAAAKYPPVGERSWGPHRAIALSGLDLKAYFASANTETFTFAMIETRAALDHMDAIARTAGIDGLFVGPSDLSIALSDGAEVNPFSGLVDRALDQVAAAANAAGKVAGAFCFDVASALALSKRGFGFLTVGSDQSFVRASAAAAVAALKG